MKKTLIFILCLASVLSVSGCGQKGPLTLPEQPKQNEQQQPNNDG